MAPRRMVSIVYIQQLVSWITIIIITFTSSVYGAAPSTASASFVPIGTPACNIILPNEKNSNRRAQVQVQVLEEKSALSSFFHRNNKFLCDFALSPLYKNNKGRQPRSSSLRSTLLSEEMKMKGEKEDEDEDKGGETKENNTKLIKAPSSISSSSSSSSSIHLISLPPLVSSDDFSKSSPKVIKDIWKWKDVVLGDGRDYFIPRPRALKALSDILIGSTLAAQVPIGLGFGFVAEEEEEEEEEDRAGPENGHDRRRQNWGEEVVEIHHVIEECAILSNCARMDILLSIKTKTIGAAGTSTCRESIIDGAQGSLVDSSSNSSGNSNSNSNISKNNVISSMQNNELPSAKLASQILVANCLLDQLSSYENVRKERGSSAALWEGISSFFDLPGMVIRNDNDGDSGSGSDSDSDSDSTSRSTGNNGYAANAAKTADDGDNINDNVNEKDGTYTNTDSSKNSRGGTGTGTSIVYIDDVTQSSKDLGTTMLRTTSHVGNIIQHFCLVAAGLARRDSRPDRTIQFRPFSSRDAHIMLQLKRTAEVASPYPKVKVILDSSLSAGKSSRDVNVVPILQKLKKYDCEGKYSTAAPVELAMEAVEDVKEMVIRPTVEKCLMKLKAQNNSERIVYFKSRVDGMIMERQRRQRQRRQRDDNNNFEKAEAESSERIKKLTHETIMKLREGCDVDVEEVLLEMNEMNETNTNTLVITNE